MSDVTNDKPHFFRDLVNVISLAKSVAAIEDVTLHEASDYVCDRLIKTGTYIYYMHEMERIFECGEAWYAPVCDSLSEALLSSRWWDSQAGAKYIEINLGSNLVSVRPDEFGIKRTDASRLFGIDSTVDVAKSSQPAIGGQTFARILKAIETFPKKYPNHLEQPPKLKDDVQDWLRSSMNFTDREAHVVKKIISEHFNLAGDTLES